MSITTTVSTPPTASILLMASPASVVSADTASLASPTSATISLGQSLHSSSSPASQPLQQPQTHINTTSLPPSQHLSLVHHQSRGRKSLPLRAGSITFIEHERLRFIVHDCPSDANLPDYIQEFKKYNVTDVVRVCEESYSKNLLLANNIQVHELKYDDGGVPPDSVLRSWLDLVSRRFGSASSGGSPAASSHGAASVTITNANSSSLSHGDVSVNGGAASGIGSVSSKSEQTIAQPLSPDGSVNGAPPCIAVHCVAGLGRAPVLVAVALIENGMSPLDAIEFVRRRRRGAFNSRQIQYVDSYKKQKPRSALFARTFSKLFGTRSSA